MKAIDSLLIMKSFAAMVRDPNNTDEIFMIADRGRRAGGPLLDAATKFMFERPGLKELYQENYAPVLPPLDELREYADGTLGREFARYIDANGLSIDFYPQTVGEGFLEYVVNRMNKSHDFWHVITGFGTSVPEEIGLQAFTLAQLQSPISAIIIAGGFLHTLLRRPDLFSATVEKTFAGYEIGKKARSIASLRFEDRLKESVESIRTEMGIAV